MRKSGFCLSILIVLFLSSCATGSYNARKIPPPVWDDIHVQHPDFRFDSVVTRIIIIGEGEDSSHIQALLEQFFEDAPGIQVVKSVNLKSIMGGAMLGYNTSLNTEQAQAVYQGLKVDHILFFETSVSPHSAYRYGGRASAKINLKLVDVVRGETLFFQSSDLGVSFPDVRVYGFSERNEISQGNRRGLLSNAYAPLKYYLYYAFGKAASFLQPVDADLVFYHDPPFGSPAYNAGIREGDKIIAYNGQEVANATQMDFIGRNNPIEQGSTRKVTIKRGNEILELKMEYPAIQPYRFN